MVIQDNFTNFFIFKNNVLINETQNKIIKKSFKLKLFG